MSLAEIWEIALLALLLWREARDQTDATLIIVACSVRNRVRSPRWWGHSWVSVILCREQYSSFNPGDPNCTKFPADGDAVFARCLAIAQHVHQGDQLDVAGGAQSYFDKSMDHDPPSWAIDGSKQRVLDAGSFHFFREIPPKAISA